MADFTTPNPNRHDIVVPFGQSFPLIVQFSDDQDLPKDMTGYSAQVLVKKNNSDSDCDALVKKQMLLTSDHTYTFTFTPQEVKDMGEGVHYYDMWLKKADGATWQQAGVYGSITVEMLTTRSQ